MKYDLRSTLRAIPLFKKLEVDEIDELIKFMSVKEYKAREVLLTEGAPSVRLFVLLEGKVAVTKGAGKSLSHICDLDAGECIGEVGVLENAPCSANVVAVTDVQTASISSDDLDRYFGTRRLAAIKILRQMVCVLATRLRQTNVSYSNMVSIAEGME